MSSILNFSGDRYWFKCLRSQIRRFFPLAWTETDRGLTTVGAWGTNFAQPFFKSSPTAERIKSGSFSADLLFRENFGGGTDKKSGAKPDSITLRRKWLSVMLRHASICFLSEPFTPYTSRLCQLALSHAARADSFPHPPFLNSSSMLCEW